jgi:predicted lipoprotein
MTTAAGPRSALPTSGLALAGAAVLLVGVIVWDTHVVRIGSEQDLRAAGFSPDAFGAAQFPRIRAQIEERAVEAVELAEAVAADRDAAAERYGVPSGIGPIFPVTLTGTVGEGRTGIFDVAVPGMPEDVRVRVQTGPAINGTELRDFPGDIVFGDFTNQIEYQDAGSAINEALKAEVLAGLDRNALTGREISVTGAFRMVNPKMWLVTPVSLAVE